MSNGLNLTNLDAPPILDMRDVFVDAIVAVQPPLWMWEGLRGKGIGQPVRMPDSQGGTSRWWAWDRNLLATLDEPLLRRLYAAVKYSGGERDGRGTTAQASDLT